MKGALPCRSLLMLPLQVLRPAPGLWLVIDKPSRVCQGAGLLCCSEQQSRH